MKFVAAKHPQLEVDALLAEGDPVWVLREQSRDATAFVLGSRHLSRTQEVFGAAAVAVPVMTHAHCPVVDVPEPEHVTQEPAYYVVEVDGSEDSAAAVDVAKAALRGAELRALFVWEAGPLRIFDEHGPQQESRRLLSEIVAGRRARYPEVELHQNWSSGIPCRCSPMPRPTRWAWWWAPGVGADSPACCWARSARACCTTRAAPSSPFRPHPRKPRGEQGKSARPRAGPEWPLPRRGAASAMLLVRRRAAVAGLEAPPGGVLAGLVIAGAATSALGLLIGGVLVDTWGWRTTFLANGLITPLSLVMGFL
ncbi:hypothetical protein [Streptomyces aureus]|uniref:hypothetical protein n=2 Tax=Streptomyces aureus TaxID=193461 RepID=UPI003CD0A53B